MCSSRSSRSFGVLASAVAASGGVTRDLAVWAVSAPGLIDRGRSCGTSGLCASRSVTTWGGKSDPQVCKTTLSVGLEHLALSIDEVSQPTRGLRHKIVDIWRVGCPIGSSSALQVVESRLSVVLPRIGGSSHRRTLDSEVDRCRRTARSMRCYRCGTRRNPILSLKPSEGSSRDFLTSTLDLEHTLGVSAPGG